MGFSNASLFHKIGSLPALLGGDLLLGGGYELGGTQLQGKRDFRQNGTLGVMAETPLGPLYLGGSLGSGWHGRVYFLLGRSLW